MSRRYFPTDSDDSWSWNDLAAALLISQAKADEFSAEVAELKKSYDVATVKRKTKSLEGKIATRDDKITKLEREVSSLNYKLEQAENLIESAKAFAGLFEYERETNRDRW